MARTYAKIEVGIWHNDDFRALSTPAQHLYFTLVTDPEISYAGVTDWRPNRLSGKAGAWPVALIESAAYELITAHFVLICESTEEALVRTFVRHDGALKNAKLSVSVANAVGSIASNELRSVVVSEMQKAKKDHPDWTAWGNDSVRSVLRRKAVDVADMDLFGADLAPAMGRQFGGDDD